MNPLAIISTLATLHQVGGALQKAYQEICKMMDANISDADLRMSNLEDLVSKLKDSGKLPPDYKLPKNE